MPERFQRLRQHEVSLALAVKLVDSVTGQSLGAAPSVSIDGVHASPVLNPSDYWLFLSPPVSLSDEAVEVVVETGWQYVDGTYSIPQDESVRLEDLDPPAAVLEVYPSADYQFGPTTPVVIGTVTHGGDPVRGASITVNHTDLETRSGSDGVFALPIQGIVREPEAMDDPIRVDPSDDPPRPITVVDDDGNRADPRLTIGREDLGSTTEDVPIVEGERVELSGEIDI